MKTRFSGWVTWAIPLVFFLLPAAWAASDDTAGNALETVEDWRGSLPKATRTGQHALVQVRNSQLSLANNIEFKVDQLHGLLRPTGTASLLRLKLFLLSKWKSLTHACKLLMMYCKRWFRLNCKPATHHCELPA